jgi:hypothetical protein
MMMIRKYRSSLPAPLAAYHSLSAVLRDTLFCFTDFQLIGPPFIIITQCQCIANYEPGRFGGLEIGVSCVATCGPGNKGTQGTCTACETGTLQIHSRHSVHFLPGNAHSFARWSPIGFKVLLYCQTDGHQKGQHDHSRESWGLGRQRHAFADCAGWSGAAL